MKLAIKTLGELQVLRDGKALTLPKSKRTRALLGYMAIVARPQRRDRLCEVLWEIPDDPRAALRWSLSKIRSLVNDPGKERLVADRERVTLLVDDIDVDYRQIMQKLEQGHFSVAEAITMEEALAHPLLEGEDLPNQEVFQRWLDAERLEAERLRAKLLAFLAQHEAFSLVEQLPWTRKWEAAAPFDPQAARRLLTQLRALGYAEEANKLVSSMIQRFQKAGITLFIGPEATPLEADETPKPTFDEKQIERELLARQKIQFCTARDGVRLAYATIGEGLPIVKAANWLSHLEHDWDAPVWSPLFRELALDYHFVRYDERGNGLSDWKVDDISFESFVTDLETVVDACKLEKFALLGISQGAAVSIEYAIRHPERVKQLILFGGYAAGWRIDADAATIKEREAIMTLTATGWGQDNPAYRQIFSSTFMPSAGPEEVAWFNNFQRLTTSADNAVRFLSVFGDIDVREKLAKVGVPTLVIHSRNDQRIPVEVGREIAAAIPGAQFVGLESDGHLLLGHEPASKVFVETIKDFVGRKPNLG